MENEPPKARGKKIISFLSVFFSVSGLIWFLVTGFESHRDRVLILVILALFAALLVLGGYLYQKMK